jgi:hypothetical protein
MFRTLEHHVLDEVGDAIPLRVFIARSALDPNPNRDRTDVLHLFGDDGQPVGQNLTMNVADFFDHSFVSHQRTGN